MGKEETICYNDNVSELCNYVFRDRRECGEETYPGSDYCILHIDIPDEDSREEADKINRLKEDKVEEKMDAGDYNFEGAKLAEVDFFARTVKGDLNFMDAEVRDDALFEVVKIKGNVLFSGAKIGGNLRLAGAVATGSAIFNKVRVGRSASFEGFKTGDSLRFSASEIKKDGRFTNSQVIGTADFRGCKIGGLLLFSNMKVGGSLRAPGIDVADDLLATEAHIGGTLRLEGANLKGDLNFRGATLDGDVDLFLTEVRGTIDFEKTRFRKPEAQETACRKAKQRYQNDSDFEKADHYYYLEMEAKRKQKSPLKRYMELPIQYIFGYGTKWQAVMLTWFLVVLGCAFIYWLGNGVETNVPGIKLTWWRYIYFSVATVTTLGYGDYHPIRGYEIIASIEAIFGTFMWAAFITIFARKYMR